MEKDKSIQDILLEMREFCEIRPISPLPPDPPNAIPSTVTAATSPPIPPMQPPRGKGKGKPVIMRAIRRSPNVANSGRTTIVLEDLPTARRRTLTKPPTSRPAKRAAISAATPAPKKGAPAAKRAATTSTFTTATITASVTAAPIRALATADKTIARTTTHQPPVPLQELTPPPTPEPSQGYFTSVAHAPPRGDVIRIPVARREISVPAHVPKATRKFRYDAEEGLWTLRWDSQGKLHSAKLRPRTPQP